MRHTTISIVAAPGLALAGLVLVPGATASAAPPTCDGLTPTIVGTSGADTLIGTPGKDVIVGLGGDDVIKGLGGHDVLCGGNGADRLVGGAGNDRLFGERNRIHKEPHRTGFTWYGIGDVLEGGAGNDLLDAGTGRVDEYWRAETFSFASAKRVDVDLAAGTATGQGRDTLVWARRPSSWNMAAAVVGSPGDDTFTRVAGGEAVYPGPGNDRVELSTAKDAVSEVHERPRRNPRASLDLYVTGEEFAGRPSGDDTYLSGGPARSGVLYDLTDGRDTVVGGPGSEAVWMSGGNRSSIALGAGPDFVQVSGDGRLGHVTGGLGEDELTRIAWGTGTSTAQVRGASRMLLAGEPQGVVHGFENWHVRTPGHLKFQGNDRDNILSGWARTINARMKGGNDWVGVSNNMDTYPPLPLLGDPDVYATYESMFRVRSGTKAGSHVWGGAGHDRAALYPGGPASRRLRGLCTSVERGC